MSFENKVVFITGSNGGLAKSFIEALLKENVKKIYCTARDLKKLEELFFKNINFLKSHREYTNSEMQNLKKMKRFLKN